MHTVFADELYHGVEEWRVQDEDAHDGIENSRSSYS